MSTFLELGLFVCLFVWVLEQFEIKTFVGHVYIVQPVYLSSLSVTYMSVHSVNLVKSTTEVMFVAI